MRGVYHYFPLPFHPWARPAAEAAACAQRQGDAAFWTLHDFLFTHQTELAPANLKERLVRWEDTVSIDRGQIDKCVSESLTSGQIEQDVALGNELGVRGTPTVFMNGEPVDEPSTDRLSAMIRQVTSGR